MRQVETRLDAQIERVMLGDEAQSTRWNILNDNVRSVA